MTPLPVNRAGKTRRLIFLALMLTLSLIAWAIETALPPLIPAVPGMRLGLANIFPLAVLLLLGPGDAALVWAARVVLAPLLSGVPTMAVYGAAGGLLAWSSMVLALRWGRRWLGAAGVSVVGAAFHSIGQMGAACLMTGTPAILSWLPVMLLASVPAGCFVGLAAGFVVRRVERLAGGMGPAAPCGGAGPMV